MTRQKTISKVLEIKKFHKEQVETEVKKAIARLNSEEQNLAALECHYQEALDTLSRKQAGGTVSVQDLELFNGYFKHLIDQIVHQESIITIRTGELNEMKHAMITAYKEQRIFEILQDRLHQSQIKKENHDMQKQADCQYLAMRAKK